MINFITVTLIYTIFLFIYLKIFSYHPIRRIHKIISNRIDKIDPIIYASSMVLLIAAIAISLGIFYNNYYNLNSDILAYCGSIIGGSFTLLGVYMTIYFTSVTRKQDQMLHDQERKEELAIQYKPIIILANDEKSNISDLNVIKIINHNPNFTDLFERIDIKYNNLLSIQIKNIGRGNAINVCVENIEINTDTIIMHSLKSENFRNIFKIIGINDYLSLEFNLPKGVEVNENYTFTNNIQINCTLNYEDEFNIIKYRSLLTMNITYNIEKDTDYSQSESVVYYYLMYKLKYIDLSNIK